MTSIATILLPAGKALGHAAEDPTVRLVPGGAPAAAALFEALTVGAEDATPEGFAGTVRRHADGATVTLHEAGPAIEIAGSEVWIRRLEFPALVASRDAGMDG